MKTTLSTHAFRTGGTPVSLFAVFCLLIAASVVHSQPATAPSGVDPAFWQRMLAVDAKAASIHDITADFTQQKYTPILKKPLTSKGIIRATASAMLWDTTDPQPTQMHITESQASLYYPKEKLEEIYPVTGQLGSLAASPLPRLSVLQKHFSFEAESVKAIDPAIADESQFIAVKLKPLDAALREHVEQVRVLLDASAGFMIRCEVMDADGDRTLISFANVRLNTGLDDSKLVIKVPGDVKIVRPLEKLVPTEPPRPSR